MKVLLSIKPEFANKIFNGIKQYEYRRTIFKKTNIDSVLVYATSPISKVIGEFEIDNIICDELESLWNKTSQHSGISEEYFYTYFGNKEKGYAIKIKNTTKYQNPLSLKEEFNVMPPQSFIYIE
ncbi:MAG: ASCH domain-containing protein [Bacillota bacterium]|jgi:predicted transcriptional regulator